MVTLFAFATIGCSDPPRPPASDIPILLIDYETTLDNHTALYIHGRDKTRYDSITLTINEMVLSKNNSFSLEYHTDLEQFDLEIEIWLGNNFYHHNASYKLTLIDNYVYEVTYPDESITNIRYTDLPFSTRLAREVMEKDG